MVGDEAVATKHLHIDIGMCRGPKQEGATGAGADRGGRPMGGGQEAMTDTATRGAGRVEYVVWTESRGSRETGQPASQPAIHTPVCDTYPGTFGTKGFGSRAPSGCTLGGRDE